MNDDIDIAAADFTITSGRSRLVDFLPVMIESFIQIFIANPNSEKNWMAYIEPLTPIAWLGMLVLFIVVPPIVCFIFFYGNVFISNVD